MSFAGAPPPLAEYERLIFQQSQVPIYDGSPTSMLKAFVLILQFQVNFNISNASISSMLSMICNFFLPKHLNSVFPKTHAELRSFMRIVGLGYTNIHCCPRNCVIYYGKYKECDFCPICKASRYREDTKGQRVPKKVSSFPSLFYFWHTKL